MYRRKTIALLLLFSITLSTGCSVFATNKPPATEVVVKRQDVPDALLVLPPLPTIPPRPRTQDQVATYANQMEEWAGVCRGQIVKIDEWSNDVTPATPTE